MAGGALLYRDERVWHVCILFLKILRKLWLSTPILKVRLTSILLCVDNENVLDESVRDYRLFILFPDS